MKNIEKYIGIPFIDKGRDFKGCDCYGLAKLYFKNELDIDIPDVIARPNQIKMAYMEYLSNISKYWIEHKEIKENTIVALKTDPNNPKLVTHFGIILKIDNKLKMLHTFRDTASHLVDLPNQIYDNKIVAYYEWKGL